MEPPRFKINVKIPAAPPSPPAPVLQSPPRKVTVKEQMEWKIPPCISNWKNPKGYTIPLDKRLACDGRGLQDTFINDNFAKFAEALYIADRKAREAVEMRAQLENRLAQKEKELKEENLVKLAQKAREERAAYKKPDADEDELERDQLRYERHKDRERQRRMAKSGPDKRTIYEREKERDVSEKIALGVPTAKPSDDSLYDQRLFNQTRGLDTGYAGGEDDVYNVYDKPWNARANLASNIYKPSKNVDGEIYGEEIESLIKNSRFNPEKNFTGIDATQATQRSGPVQFEKKISLEEDPLELDKFLSQAKKHKRSDRRSPSPRKSKKDRR
ncbi:SNW domain-containing protein 1 [Thelohanellus kitauei]|uniref:SNW domain-containing protein 1 n=1 Tax=Thelohanellus kitauei TaxID=669202 RepID=A0A0C2N4A4_THEKT|nr:SNW domain-containing protein 1 [Thelohanellus kitauei]